MGILETIRSKWNIVSQFGLKESMQISEQKKLILTNQVSILLFLFLFTLSVILSVFKLNPNFVRELSILSILIIPFLNKKGFYRVTSFMMSIIFPVNVLIFSTLIKIEFHGTIDIIYYFVPRFLILGGLILPLILIDVRYKVLLIIAVFINFLCLISYDYVNNIMGVGIDTVHLTIEKYGLVNAFILLPYFFIILGFSFLQNINLKYEKRVLELLDEIKIKNVRLEAQKEEIAAQRDTVIEQKECIEDQKKEITDSINYAKRIQQALLPDLSLIGNQLAVSPKADSNQEDSLSSSHPIIEYRLPVTDYFILFRPKDIVSGDFYWATNVDNHLIITVADCTGHGVPGAFMSMLGISFLNEIVRKEGILQPGSILNELRKSVIEALKQTGVTGTQKDGMDISLIAINTTPQAQTSEGSEAKTSEGLKPSEVLWAYAAQWAGANNPLYVIARNEITKQSISGITSPSVRNDEIELHELKGDKMPIAIYERMDDFTNHELQLFNGDKIYMMSDGYEDQFGGPDNKKFKAKQLKELISSNVSSEMEEQGRILEMVFDTWKGSYEQIDDVTLMGVRI